MRIKQLELIGFKSFPQRTVLDFPSGVTAVVGPNGCGKSNIVDAIRWALGEQSAKHLRGDAMEAVVFNGNERMGPLGMAEVSLTFENDGSARAPTEIDLESSTLPDHFRNLTEIRITRRYYRSGESEYFINKTSCRLKDITELFLGTGIGSKAYAIIEQGRVEQLINAKPEERRLFIEEAAGTTLYRSRKLAAERKMERSRENLARVNDILREIERQVQYLQRQAKRAEEYRRLQAELRELELRLAAFQWRQLQEKLGELEASLDEATEAERAARAALEESERVQHEAAQNAAAAEQRHMQLRENLAVLEAERESLRSRLLMLDQERQERERRAGRLGAELEAARQRRAQIETEAGEAELEREEWARVLHAEDAQLADGEEKLREARAAATTAQADLEAAKGALIEHLTREVEVRNAAAALERRREDMARQIAKLRGEEAALEQRLQEIADCGADRKRDLTGLRERLAAAAGEKDSRAERLRALAEARRHWEREAAELETTLLQVRSRLESIEQIQRNYEGFDRGVRAIMRSERHPEGVLGVVADVIDIPQPYERAVAAALGERLQYIIVRGEDEGLGAVDLLRRQASGRGSFIPMEPRLEQDRINDALSMNGTSKRLLDVIGVDSRFRAVAESLLGEVVLVSDLSSAVELWRKNGVHVTLVTPEGDVVAPSGVITGGSDHLAEEEILSRRREIESLRLQVAAAGERLSAVREEIDRVVREMAETEEAVRMLGEGVHDLTLQIVAAEKDIERLDLERPQCVSRRDLVRYEVAGLIKDDEAAAEELSAVRQRAEALGIEHSEREREVALRRSALEEAARKAEELSAEITAVKVRLAERRERQQAAAARAEALRRQQAELGEREAALAAEREGAERERLALEESIRAAHDRQSEQEEQRARLQAEVESAEAAAKALSASWHDEQRRGREIMGRVDELRGRVSQLELSRSELRIRAEHLTETIREKYETHLPEEATERPVEEIPEDSAARLDALKARLARIGEVNVGAIDELRELEERAAFLRTQRDDLECSLADLERTIQKLNRVSRTRFAETFARANETFQKVFPRLFRGGEARLVLTDENNLLESGVDIIVRPPGKKLDSVALLSGGEKALVAVSLIFSLFLINPTPFCILDEVDAPLDDANIGRFVQMIREMNDRLQFLVITHNKRTMEAADVLYGVTMQEPGVSKVISVAMTA